MKNAVSRKTLPTDKKILPMVSLKANAAGLPSQALGSWEWFVPQALTRSFDGPVRRSFLGIAVQGVGECTTKAKTLLALRKQAAPG